MFREQFNIRKLNLLTNKFSCYKLKIVVLDQLGYSPRYTTISNFTLLNAIGFSLQVTLQDFPSYFFSSETLIFNTRQYRCQLAPTLKMKMFAIHAINLLTLNHAILPKGKMIALSHR